MAIAGQYIDVSTGAVFPEAYGKIFPIQVQSIPHPVSGAAPWGRYSVNVWVDSQSYMDGKSPYIIVDCVMEGAAFVAAFASGAALCKAAMDAAQTVPEQMAAMEKGILAPAESDAVSRPEFAGWGIVA